MVLHSSLIVLASYLRARRRCVTELSDQPAPCSSSVPVAVRTFCSTARARRAIENEACACASLMRRRGIDATDAIHNQVMKHLINNNFACRDARTEVLMFGMACREATSGNNHHMLQACYTLPQLHLLASTRGMLQHNPRCCLPDKPMAAVLRLSLVQPPVTTPPPYATSTARFSWPAPAPAAAPAFCCCPCCLLLPPTTNSAGLMVTVLVQLSVL
jgi:hypothetical protein